MLGGVRMQYAQENASVLLIESTIRKE
jgi:hypothetical protein